MNMKKLITLLAIAFVGALTFTACESNQFGGVPSKQIAPMVTLEEISSTTIDLADPSASVTMRFNVAGDNTSDATYYISQSPTIDGAVEWKTLSSFPTEETITMGEISNLLGNVSPGRIYFHARIRGNDGEEYTYANLEPADFGNPGQAQAYRFDIVAFCNYDPAATAGTYTITSNLDGGFWGGFFGTPGTRTIVANADHFIIEDFSVPGVDIRIDVTPEGSLSIAQQNTGLLANTPTFGADYGDMFFVGDDVGVIFSCIGELSFTVARRVNAGSFGGITFTLVKQ